MPTERVTLDLDAVALYAARFVADATDVPLADYVSRLVRKHAVEEGFALSAETLRMDPEEDAAWREETLALMFGEGERGAATSGSCRGSVMSERS